jgi:hypothetical protein
LVQGYETDLADKFNTGDLLRGNLYIDSLITPYMNIFKGPTAGRRFTLMTGLYEDGEVNLEYVGAIHNIDENESQIFFKEKLYDST